MNGNWICILLHKIMEGPGPDHVGEGSVQKIAPLIDDIVWVEPQVYKLIHQKIYNPQPPQKSQAWKDDRMKCETASGMGQILGMFGPSKRKESFQDKTNQRMPFEGNFATRFGERHEGAARRDYERLTGNTVFEFGLLHHPDIPWLAGSPDGVTQNGILLEIKCPARKSIDLPIEDYYMAQVQCLMHILDLKHCHFVKYAPGNRKTETLSRLVLHNVPRDPYWLERNLPIIQEFHEEVEAYRQANPEWIHHTWSDFHFDAPAITAPLDLPPAPPPPPSQ